MGVLIETLEQIRDGAEPYNEREAFSWVETAKKLAETAIKKHEEEKKTLNQQASIFEILVNYSNGKTGINKTAALIERLYPEEHRTLKSVYWNKRIDEKK